MTVEAHEIAGKIVLTVEIPIGKRVCRRGDQIFDRNYEADINITKNIPLLELLFARKSGEYYVNKVTSFGIGDLRQDLIAKARTMATLRREGHPWQSMSDSELLRSAGLLGRIPETQQECVTIAGVLLFGKDETIRFAVPQHATDALLRVHNIDRYDDRDMIITNLLETYDRLIAFGQKHLNDPFVLDGIRNVSARDKLLREIFSNSLAHRDYSSGQIARFVIERSCCYTENANIAQSRGPLRLETLMPVPKNPPIAHVFREIGLADELGSGMRNAEKFSRLYSGQSPEFIEGDIFKTIIPLGPTPQEFLEGAALNETTGSGQLSKRLALLQKILIFCQEPRSRAEIVEHCGYKSRKRFAQNFITPLIDAGLLQRTLPEKPNSRLQKYVIIRQ